MAIEHNFLLPGLFGKLAESKPYKPRLKPGFLPPGYMRLDFATDRLGRLLLGDQWNGEELKARDHGERYRYILDVIVHLRKLRYVMAAYSKTMDEVQALNPAELNRLAYSDPSTEKKPEGEEEATVSPTPLRGLFALAPWPALDLPPVPDWPQLPEEEQQGITRYFEERQKPEAEAYGRFSSVADAMAAWLYSSEFRAVVLADSGEKIDVPSNVWGTDMAPMLAFQTGRICGTIDETFLCFRAPESAPPTDRHGYELVSHNVFIDAAPLNRMAASLAAPAPERSAAAEPPKNKGGAPTKFDWEAMYIEIIVRADLDFLPEKQADLEREMAQWFVDVKNKEPSTSALRSKIAPIYLHARRGKVKKGQ